MYHQINPTEMFRERQLVLLRESENRRLVRRQRARRTLEWMGRAALFCAGLAAMLALILVSALLAAMMILATAVPAPVSTLLRAPARVRCLERVGDKARGSEKEQEER